MKWKQDICGDWYAAIDRNFSIQVEHIGKWHVTLNWNNGWSSIGKTHGYARDAPAKRAAERYLRKLHRDIGKVLEAAHEA